MALSNEQRRNAEREIVRRLIVTAKAMGYKLESVDDGSDYDPTPVFSIDEAMSLAFGVDEAHLYFKDVADRPRWVFLVFGNDGYDVVADYSVSFEPVIKAIEPLVRAWEKAAGL